MQDASTLIVSAITAGIIASTEPLAELVIRDAYNALKERITAKYRADVQSLEEAPTSEEEQASLQEALKKGGVEQDLEAIDESKRLLELVQKNHPEVLLATAIDFSEVEATYIKIRGVYVEGKAEGLRFDNVKVKEGIDIEDVSAKNSPK